MRKLTLLALLLTLATVVSGQNAANHAFRMEGKKYAPGKEGLPTPEAGFDCSGLVRWAYREMLQTDLPRSADQQWRWSGGETIQPQQLQPGDVVFFHKTDPKNKPPGVASHCGIFVGGTSMINAWSKDGLNGSVRVTNYVTGDYGYWKDKWLGARRLSKKWQAGRKILLRPWFNGQPVYCYLMAEGGGNGKVFSYSHGTGSYEKWLVEPVDGWSSFKHLAHVNLKALTFVADPRRNNVLTQFYLSDDGAGNGHGTAAMVNRSTAQLWERWIVHRESGPDVVRNGDRIYLESGHAPLCLGVNYPVQNWPAGAYFPFVNNNWGGWETFTVIVVD